MTMRERVLEFLKRGGTYTPTEIAMKTGYDHWASNRVLGVLSDLEKRGQVKRNIAVSPSNGRRVEYSYKGGDSQ